MLSGEPKMTASFRALASGAVAVAALGVSCVAGAQSASADPLSGLSGAATKSGKSFIDVAVGRASYGTSCGNVPGLSCSRTTTSYSITAGNMFTQNLGIELAYLDLGRANRADGSVRARGLNLSAVGRVPLGDSLALEAKVGTTYGVTHVNVPVVSGLSSGRDSGFGLACGVGLDVNVARGVQGTVGWEQHALHFAGQGTSTVRNITVGLGYSF
jgi:OOP family OmpA-OmpF porin